MLLSLALVATLVVAPAALMAACAAASRKLSGERAALSALAVRYA